MPLAEARGLGQSRQSNRTSQLHSTALSGATGSASALAQMQATRSTGRASGTQISEMNLALATEPTDPQADHLALQTLAYQCQTYSPLVGLEESDSKPPTSLLLDITGCEIHFGGEASLARQLRHELAQRGYDARIAIADTIGAAWAMSHYGVSTQGPIAVLPQKGHAPVLRRLPIAGLRLSSQIMDPLLKLDLNKIGQVENLPRSTLPSRFGKELQRRLDQAWGTAHELITPERLQQPLTEIWNFEDTLTSRQTLELVARELFERVLKQLEPRRAGIRELQCHFRGRVDRLTLTLRLLQPTSELRHLWDLLQLEWDRQEVASHKSGTVPKCLTDGISSVCLEIPETAPLRVRQETLFEPEPGQKEALAFRQFVERLSSRLGEKSVLKSQPAPDYQPEYACDYRAWCSDVSKANKPEKDLVEKTEWDTSLARTRPLRLLANPLRVEARSTFPPGSPYFIRWDSHDQTVVKTWHSERIATGWWREHDVQRDYYHIETDRGQHLWVFYCAGNAEWFVHGMYE